VLLLADAITIDPSKAIDTSIVIGILAIVVLPLVRLMMKQSVTRADEAKKQAEAAAAQMREAIAAAQKREEEAAAQARRDREKFEAGLAESLKNAREDRTAQLASLDKAHEVHREEIREIMSAHRSAVGEITSGLTRIEEVMTRSVEAVDGVRAEMHGVVASVSALDRSVNRLDAIVEAVTNMGGGLSDTFEERTPTAEIDAAAASSGRRR